MSQTAPTSLTCPAGHAFPYEQLTTRDGLNVCPVCDRTQWASPRTTRPWSRLRLTNPLLVLVGAIVMLLVETISAIGIGTTYDSQHVGGAAWLIAGSAVSLVGVVVVGVGIVRIAVALRSQSWSRAMLSVPLLVVAGGAAVLTLVTCSHWV
jgi:hypothetical protein